MKLNRFCLHIFPNLKELSSYLYSFMNNEKVEEQLDIYSLDVITNYFLNRRDDYQLQEQKSIIEKLAGLYTLVTNIILILIGL